MVHIDIEARTLTVEVSDEEFNARKALWKPVVKPATGWLRLYRKECTSPTAALLCIGSGTESAAGIEESRHTTRRAYYDEYQACGNIGGSFRQHGVSGTQWQKHM